MSKDVMNELDELESLTQDDVKEEGGQQAPKKAKAEPVQEKQQPDDTALEDGEIPLVNPLEDEGNLNEILDFDDLDLALKGQASMFAYYSEAAARAQMQYNRAKQNVEQVEARMNYVVRQKMTDAGEKITEKAIEAKVKLTKAYRNANESLNDAQYINKLCASVVEAFHQREQMLIQTCKRAELEMMTTGSYKSRLGREGRDEAMTEVLKNKTQSA